MVLFWMYDKKILMDTRKETQIVRLKMHIYNTLEFFHM